MNAPSYAQVTRQVPRKLATEAVLNVVQQYHADLVQRLADEAALIPRRTAILERLREQQKTEDGDVNK